MTFTRTKKERSLSHRNRVWDKKTENGKEISTIFSEWRSLGESNPCFSLERGVTWTLADVGGRL